MMHCTGNSTVYLFKSCKLDKFEFNLKNKYKKYKPVYIKGLEKVFMQYICEL